MLGTQIVGTGLNNGPQQGAPTDLDAVVSAFALASAALAEQLAATINSHATVVSALQDSASNVGFLGVTGLGWGMLGGDSETVPPQTPAGLSATATGHATGTATVSAGFGLATSIAGHATATVALAAINAHTVDLAATAHSSASVSATIVERHGCNALIQGSSTVTATAFKMTSLTAAPSGHATVSATSRRAYAFQATSTGRASVIVSLRNAVPLAGIVHGRTVVTPSLRARILLAAVLHGHGSMGVDLSAVHPIHLVGRAAMSTDVTITHHRMLTLLYSVGFKETKTATFTITGLSTPVTRPLIAAGSSPIEPVVVNYT